MDDLSFIKQVFETGGIPALALLALVLLIGVIYKHGLPHKSAAPETHTEALAPLREDIREIQEALRRIETAVEILKDRRK